MLIALGCMTLVTLATITFAHSLVRDHREARAQWALQERELLERIQRPERIPHTQPTEPFEVPEHDPERAVAWAQIGQVSSISDTYGLTDEDG